MAYEQKDNSGAIFKNDKKTKETQPDYQGKIVVDGAEKSISLWVKKSKAGKSYFSAAIQEPYRKEDSVPATGGDEVDDLPF